MVRGVRRSRTGRVLIAIRENDSAARSFGIQANATYIDAKVDFPVFCAPTAEVCEPGVEAGPNATVLRTRIPDVSKWTFNLVGMYEQGPFTARLSYNHRTSYPEGTVDPRDGFFTLQGRGRSTGRLDWSSSYNVTDNFTLFFDWTNILKKPYRQDFSSARDGAARAEYIRFLRYEETILSGGVRFRFNAPKKQPVEVAPYVAPPLPPVAEPVPAVGASAPAGSCPVVGRSSLTRPPSCRGTPRSPAGRSRPRRMCPPRSSARSRARSRGPRHPSPRACRARSAGP